MPNKIFQSRALKEVKRKIVDAVSEPGGILAIIGEVGIGKTIATIDGLGSFEDVGNNVIWCRQLDKENLKIGVIVSSIIRHFNELPRKDIDARTEQVRRLLGQSYSNDKKTIMVIDEAHALHYQTLRALKRLLELNFGNQIGLLSIVMVAPPALYEKLNQVEEISLRTDILEMRGLTNEEAKEYLSFVLNWNRIKLENDVIDYLSQQNHNPLKLVIAVNKIDEIQKRLGSTLPLAKLKSQFLSPLRQKIEESGLSQRQLAQKANISATTLNQVLQGNYPGNTQKIIKDVEKALVEVQ
jgi:type II secretory pathway predicted ATPase ExeA